MTCLVLIVTLQALGDCRDKVDCRDELDAFEKVGFDPSCGVASDQAQLRSNLCG